MAEKRDTDRNNPSNEQSERKSDESKCFLCNSECEVHRLPTRHRVKFYRCSYCGEFVLDEDFKLFVPNININEESVKFKVACLLNERRLKGFAGVALSDKADKKNLIEGLPQVSVKELLGKFPKTSREYLDRTLSNLCEILDTPFSSFTLIPGSLDRLIFFAIDAQYCITLIKELSNYGWIEYSGTMRDFTIRVTDEGWRKVQDSKEQGKASKTINGKSSKDDWREDFKRFLVTVHRNFL